MTTTMSTPCSECVNTYWEKVMEQGQWVYRCTNCWNTRPVVERKAKGDWTAIAERKYETFILTDKGWLTPSEAEEQCARTFWKRRSKNYYFWLNNPPFGCVVEETYHEY